MLVLTVKTQASVRSPPPVVEGEVLGKMPQALVVLVVVVSDTVPAPFSSAQRLLRAKDLRVETVIQQRTTPRVVVVVLEVPAKTVRLVRRNLETVAQELPRPLLEQQMEFNLLVVVVAVAMRQMTLQGQPPLVVVQEQFERLLRQPRELRTLVVEAVGLVTQVAESDGLLRVATADRAL